MIPTAIVYSSHNRSPYLHREWIVERALQNPYNKTILQLPMSMKERHQQEYCWGNFRWYFDQFTKWGLYAIPFYWNEDLKKDDVETLFHYLETYEVVILGGGSGSLGLSRYKALGERFFGDPDMFERILHQRQDQGKLTVGFSAGASQLGQHLGTSDFQMPDNNGFGLARNIYTALHHEWGREDMIRKGAREFPLCMSFGLPNDSALAVDQGYLPSGNIWQIIEFIVDTSWDIPEDGWHIKTRQGLNIVHYYEDGREWTFHNLDKMVRVMSPDNRYQDAWVVQSGNIFDYGTQQPSGYRSVEHILETH